MSKSDASELDILKYVLAGIAPTWQSYSNLFLSLHTADPGEAGAQNTSEAAYGGYTRVTISRSTTAWTISGTTNGVSVIAFSFPACVTGSATVTHVGLGITFSGTGELLYSGTLSASLAISTGITPSFDTGSVTITED